MLLSHSRRRSLPLSLLALAVVPLARLPVAKAADAPYSKTAAIRVERTFEVSADVGSVWSSITSAAGLGSLTGFQAKDPQAAFRKLGDAIDGKVAGDDGTLVCTGWVTGKQLRVSWEPANGSYVCHDWIKLVPTATSTKIVWVNRYTDDEVATADQTAKQTAAAADGGVESFKVQLRKR